VFLQSGEILPEASVEAGWARLRDDAGKKDDSEESRELLQTLEELESKAKAGSNGLWASSGGKIENSYEVSDAKQFSEKWKGKPIDAVVEKVFSGDRMILRMLVSPTEHLQTMVVVAGIRAPATKRTNPLDGKEQPAEPLGNESRHFVESRLLQRTVKVDVLGTTPQGGLVCEVKHPNGSIAEFLLKAGLARCFDLHSTILGGRMSSLRQAEKQARDGRLGLFKNIATQKSTAGEQDAVITRIQTADTIYYRDKSGEEKRAQLASIRQPKAADPKQAPFQADAKELLRKKLIGKHVKIVKNGEKEATEGFDARDVVTLLVNEKNVALQMVEAGYASVIRHRKDDGLSLAAHRIT